jgi:hypothetical protein
MVFLVQIKIMCDFDKEYNLTFESNALTCQYNSQYGPYCVLDQLCSDNWDNFTCPNGYIKNPNLSNQPQCSWKIQCKDNCLSYYVANDYCVYKEPNSNDPAVFVDCCTEDNYIVGNPPTCPKNFCPNNNDEKAPCVSQMSLYCSNKNPDDEQCRQFLFSTTNQNAKDQVISGFFDQQMGKYDKLTNPYNARMASYCSNSNLNVSKVCEDKLKTYCSGVKNRADIFNNLDFANLCGCHLDQDVYITSKDDPNGLCDPICNLPSSFKRQDINPNICTKDICIFEGSSVNSIITGKINVKEICGEGNNRCYFAESTLDTIKKYQNNYNFTTNCSECYSFKDTDKILGQDVRKIDCIGKIVNPNISLIIGAGLSIILIIGIIFLLFV